MDNELDPIVGNWYRRIDGQELFRVVGLDETRDAVEIQNFDGDVEEVDVNTWFDMELELAEAPEDWTGPIDDVDVDDLDDGETSAASGGFGNVPKTGVSGEWEVEELEDERGIPDDSDSDGTLNQLEP